MRGPSYSRTAFRWLQLMELFQSIDLEEQLIAGRLTVTNGGNMNTRTSMRRAVSALGAVALVCGSIAGFAAPATATTTAPEDCPVAVHHVPRIGVQQPKPGYRVSTRATFKDCHGTVYPATKYHWLRNRQETIAGAGNSTYRLRAEDVNKTIAAKAYFVSPHDGKIYTALSPSTRRVRPVFIAVMSSPKVSGQPTVGSTLTATSGYWNMPGLSIKYRWLRDRNPISGATSSAYVLTKHDASKSISVKVYASKITYAEPGTALSAPLRVK